MKTIETKAGMIHRNFDPEASFFVIDSQNLESVNSGFFGYSILDGTVVDSLASLRGRTLSGEGAYVSVEREGDTITIRQDFIGSYGLYLFREGEYFALSNSFVRLAEYIKSRHVITLNQAYADYFLTTGLCSAAYAETMIREIELIDRSAVLKIDVQTGTLAVEYIDYEENTVDINTEEGLMILDQWFEKWTRLIRNLIASTNNIQTDLTGGFDSRLTFLLMLASGGSLENLFVHSIHDTLHTHAEDYEIASMMAEHYGFTLNNTSGRTGGFYYHSIEDILDIAFYTKLCFHKQFYFKHFICQDRRYAFTGNGGECVRSYWNLSKEEYIASVVDGAKGFSGPDHGRIVDAVRSVIRASFDGIQRKFTRLGRPVPPEDMTLNLYRETRCRNHFGKMIVEGYFSNTITFCPLLDPSLHKLRLDAEGCRDKNLLISVIYTRYCDGILAFKFDGNRAIQRETIQYAMEINRAAPFIRSDSIAEIQGMNFDNAGKVYQDLPRVPNGKPDELIRLAYQSRDVKNTFLTYYDEGIYEHIWDNANKKNFYPLEDVYTALGIEKILRETMAVKTLQSGSPSMELLEKAYAGREEQSAAGLRNHPYLKNYITARIDMKNQGGDDNDLEIMDITDRDADISMPAWYQKNGSGYIVSSQRGTMRIIARCKNTGELKLALRGMDVRDRAGERIPFWIDYTALWVNDERVFDDVHAAWHDKAYFHNREIKDGEILTILIEWRPHVFTVNET